MDYFLAIGVVTAPYPAPIALPKANIFMKPLRNALPNRYIRPAFGAFDRTADSAGLRGSGPYLGYDIEAPHSEVFCKLLRKLQAYSR